MTAYLMQGRVWAPEDQGWELALAAVHEAGLRPLCLCARPPGGQPGIEMYTARLGHGHVIKRMPFTGSQHAPDCPSFEPAAELSGLGQVLGSAIQEDPATGTTALKLGFSLSKQSSRAMSPAAGDGSDSVSSDGTKLSLRGLLHYLWDQAELTRWHPGFAGKRAWGTVRKQLLLASADKMARGDCLQSRLYVPEVFSVEHRDAIAARRMAQWAQAVAVPGKPQQLMLVIAEVKEIVAARYGFKAVVKHVPDLGFALDEQLFRRLGRRFESELAFWAAADDIHMVAIATFSVAPSGIPTIVELSLMPVTRQWLPVEDGFEKQLVERLVADGRSFVKGLRYNLGAASEVASATLTDCEDSAPLLFVARTDSEQDRRFQASDPSAPAWIWNPLSEAMPPLPSRQLTYVRNESSLRPVE